MYIYTTLVILEWVEYRHFKEKKMGQVPDAPRQEEPTILPVPASAEPEVRNAGQQLVAVVHHLSRTFAYIYIYILLIYRCVYIYIYICPNYNDVTRRHPRNRPKPLNYIYIYYIYTHTYCWSWILNPTPLDSRSFFGILNLESYPLGFKRSFRDLESWILPPWIQYFFLGILNLESWIRCTSWRVGWEHNCKKCNFGSPNNALSFRVQNI